MNLPLAKGAAIPNSGDRPLVDLERHEVSSRVISDPDIYRIERERLWPKIWALLGHESEIPNPGDFVTRYIGEDMVILVRDRKGEIQVLLNSCTHRGMPVCRADMGQSSTFTCPYHGWTFGTDGELRGMPIGNEKLEGDVLDKSQLGLKRARVGLHVGLVFATFDQSAPSLLDWLGDAAWYLKLNYGRTERGMEVLGPPQRWIVEGNWKLAAEQFVGSDSYHVYTLHRSMFELGIIGKVADITPNSAPNGNAITVSFPQGHSFRCFPNYVEGRDGVGASSRDKLFAMPPPGATRELVEQMFPRFDEDQLRLLADVPPTVGGLFPNVATFCFFAAHPDGGILGAAHGFHVFVPRGPDKVEWWNWILVEKDAPEELKDRIAETFLMLVGPTGMIESDDAECWPLMQRVTRGSIAAEGVTGTIKYQALVGENKPANWPGGGMVSEGFSKDDGQWAFWKRYGQFIEGETW